VLLAMLRALLTGAAGAAGAMLTAMLASPLTPVGEARLAVPSPGRLAGLLKALGFVRHQVAAAVCWQATTVALAGIAVGAPTGIAVGRVLWRVFATDFGVVPVDVVEPILIAALVVGVLAVANALAAVPALRAARSHPARLLRAE
jgi:ABC-type antimicrobial peptide transport system permease subunit